MSIHHEVGRLLSEAREAAGKTQKDIANALGVHQSKVSRLEQGESVEPGDFGNLVAAIGSPEAARIGAAMDVTWRHLPRPSLRHPNLDNLIEIEAALELLDGFRQGPNLPQVLAGQADLLFRRLQESGEFLLRLDHRIGYVGEIGVGKTTAACRQTGLVEDPLKSEDLRGMLLDTGGGRTTQCDVVIKAGAKFTISVEPLTDQEVYRLSAELCRGIVDRKSGDLASTPGTDFKPPEEIERALRNMAGLPRPTKRKNMPPPADPAVELAASNPSETEFKAAFASRLALWRRTRRDIDFDGVDHGAGRRWLRETFNLINNGRHPEFSLPARITVTVPFKLLTATKYDVDFVDTRGVDGSAIRPDIVGRLKDPRALTVLCSSWGAAPDVTLQELLRHVTETEVDPALLSRVAILVLSRSGNALSMRHDSGEPAGDVEDGYEIKKEQVADALQRINLLGVDVFVFDAAADDPAELSEFLAGKLDAMRAAQAVAGRQTIDAIRQMLENVKEAAAMAALAAVNNDLRIFAKRHRQLKASRTPVHERLIDAIRSHHPRTLWAATRRNGEFWNFDVYQHLGDGAAADAKRRAGAPVAGLREIIANKLADKNFASARGFLGQLQEDIANWEADFVRAARHHAVTVFRPELATASELWAECENFYGCGGGFRDDVARVVRAWFEEEEDLQDQVARKIERAWQSSVLKPLRKAAGEE